MSRSLPVRTRPTIGLALGGGFARGLAHIGVLQVLEESGIRVDYLAGISAGSMVAAAYASGTSPEEIARLGAVMGFSDVARWTLCKLGFLCTDGMTKLLRRLLKVTKFEEMQLPLAIAATDLQTGEPVIFEESGDVSVAIRASCAFPGIFQPVRWNDRILTDGAISMEVPAKLVRDMGADYVISVAIPCEDSVEPNNLLDVVARSLQILQARTVESWRKHSDLVIVPQVSSYPWHDFSSAKKIIAAGAAAARQALSRMPIEIIGSKQLSEFRETPGSSPVAA